MKMETRKGIRARGGVIKLMDIHKFKLLKGCDSGDTQSHKRPVKSLNIGICFIMSQ